MKNEAISFPLQCCVIRSFAVLVQTTYMDAYHGVFEGNCNKTFDDLHENKGRNRGINAKFWKPIYEDYGAKEVYSWELEDYGEEYFIKKPKLTVKQALKKYCKKGRFAIQIKKHIFAVVDGKIINDWMEGNRQHEVRGIWEF